MRSAQATGDGHDPFGHCSYFALRMLAVIYAHCASWRRTSADSLQSLGMNYIVRIFVSKLRYDYMQRVLRMCSYVSLHPQFDVALGAQITEMPHAVLSCDNGD